MRSALRSAGCGLLAALTVLSGCYTYIPVDSTNPPAGEVLAFEISDQGRVGLRDRLGPGVDRIEGRVKGMEGEQYLVEVYRVAQLSGGKSEWSQWSGETMRLDRGYVTGYRSRKLSRARTWLLAGGITAGLVVLIATTSLKALFQGEREDPPIDPPSSQRVPVQQFRTRIIH
jgi:hypothetical protein